MFEFPKKFDEKTIFPDKDGLAMKSIEINERDYPAALLVDKNGVPLTDFVADNTYGYFCMPKDTGNHDNLVPYTRLVYPKKDIDKLFETGTKDNSPKPMYRDICGVVFSKNDPHFARKCEIAERMARYLLSSSNSQSESLILEDLIKPFGQLKEPFYDCFIDPAHVKAIIQHEKTMLLQWKEQINEKIKTNNAPLFDKKLQEEVDKFNKSKEFVNDFIRYACEQLNQNTLDEVINFRGL